MFGVYEELIEVVRGVAKGRRIHRGVFEELLRWYEKFIGRC